MTYYRLFLCGTGFGRSTKRDKTKQENTRQDDKTITRQEKYFWWENKHHIKKERRQRQRQTQIQIQAQVQMQVQVQGKGKGKTKIRHDQDKHNATKRNTIQHNTITRQEDRKTRTAHDKARRPYDSHTTR
jgi:hypothetical protein